MGKTELELTEKQMIMKNEERCQLFSRDAFFDPGLVVGKTWRIYLTWGGDMQYKCVDLRFQYADELVIERIADDMSDYLGEQPEWHEASLVQYNIINQREMLLFPYRNVSGRFYAVSNLFRGESPNFQIKKGEVPLLKYFMKLLLNGKYLFVIDCHIGMAFLCARPYPPPFRADLEGAVADLGLQNDIPACTQEKNDEESFYKELEQKNPDNRLLRY